MELFDYSRTFLPTDFKNYSKYFDKANITIEVNDIKENFVIHFTTWGEHFTDIEVDGKVIWSGKLSTP